MQQRITVNTLRSWKAEPPAKQIYVSDPESPLRVRRNADGSLAFCVRRRRHGKRERRTLGQWPDLGLAEARQMARQWATGMDVKTQAEQHAQWLTLGEVFDAYFDEIRLYAKSWEYRRRTIEAFVPRDMLRRPADSISRGEIRSWLLSQVPESGHRANRLHKIFAAAYNRALDAELVDRNPLAGLRRPFKEKPRKNILDFEQLRKIWNACAESDDYRLGAIQLLMLTGCRLQEILGARWETINAEGWLVINDNKSDRPYRVYLSDLAWSVIEALPTRDRSPFLFPAPQNLDRPVASLQHLKAALDEEVNVGSWRIHDLRGTFLTQSVAKCKISPPVAKVCVNHSLPGVTDANYIERAVYWPDCKEAWIAYSKLIEGILEGRVGRVLTMPEREAS